MLGLLLSHGARADQEGEQQRTALHEACARGQGSCAALLIQHGASICARDQEGNTPLHIAAIGANFEVIKLLLENKDCGTTYAFWFFTPHTNVLPFFSSGINEVDGKGETALHDAAYGGHSEVVSLMLQRGADVSTQDRIGSTCRSMHLFSFFKFFIIFISKIICAVTPLHWAAWNGHTKTAKILIDKGAAVNSTTQEGN